MPARWQSYWQLMRFDKPIGFFLLLWPTLWALWLASHGHPSIKILILFVCGVFVMRTLGCVLNDMVDRDYDPYVTRTKNRPLARKAISLKEALLLSLGLALVAFIIVLFLNQLTFGLAIIGILLTLGYPFLKRFTYLPQIGLGVAFAWGVPMAFAAQSNHISWAAWVLFLSALIWPIIYDTMYAMVDREDDVKIGIKSAAILFGQMDRWLIGLLQILFIVSFIMVGIMFGLHVSFYLSILAAALLFIYQQWLLANRNKKNYYKAFQNNNWVGLIIFIGIASNYLYPIHVETIYKHWQNNAKSLISVALN